MEERTRELHSEIDERQKATNRLRAPGAQHAQAKRTAHTHNWITDAAFDEWIACPKNPTHVLKTPVDQLLSSHSKFITFIHCDDRSRVKNTYADIAPTPRPYDTKYRYCLPGGELLYLREDGEPVSDETRTLVSFRDTTQDITRDKLAQQALEEIETRSRAIVDTAADGTITINDYEITGTFNQTAERMLGFRQHEVIGKI